MGFKSIIGEFFKKGKKEKTTIEQLDISSYSNRIYNFTTGKWVEEPEGVIIDEIEDEILSEGEIKKIDETFDERVKRLKANPKFMQELIAIMQHNTSESAYYIHGTTDINTSKRIIKQGLLRVDKAEKYNENSGEDPMYTTAECVDDIIMNISDIARDEADYLIEYGNSRGGRGRDAVVIIDNPIEDGKRKQIIQPISNKQQIQISTQWKNSVRAQSVVQPMYIVGYVDKVNAQVVLNPLYYNYEKLSQRMAELPEIGSDMLASAVKTSEEQIKTGEINDRVSEIKNGQREREEDNIMEQDNGRWEF